MAFDEDVVYIGHMLDKTAREETMLVTEDTVRVERDDKVKGFYRV